MAQIQRCRGVRSIFFSPPACRSGTRQRWGRGGGAAGWSGGLAQRQQQLQRLPYQVHLGADERRERQPGRGGLLAHLAVGVALGHLLHGDLGRGAAGLLALEAAHVGAPRGVSR